MLAAGEEINGYTIVTDLNTGNYCIAYKAQKNGKDYFIKEYISPTRVKKPEKYPEKHKKYVDFTEQQARLIARLNKLGDNIEKTLDTFQSTYHYFQVKPFIVGQDLQKWMVEPTNRNYEKRKLVAVMVCEAIKAIHSAGIIHKDLKPQQFMVVKDSSPAGVRLILMDFDWSIIDGHCLEVVATPWYGSPEVNPKDITEKTDVFTLGIILCEILAGTGPYSHNPNATGLTAPTWLNWVKSKSYKEPRSINSNITKNLSDLIVKCLDPVATGRPTIDEIIAALNDTEAELNSNKCEGICLSSGSSKLLIPVRGTVGGKDFRTSFSTITDDAGNKIYRYFEADTMVLQVGSDDSKVTLSTNIALNKLLVNGKELSDIPMPVNEGDTLELFATGKKKVIAKFKVEFRYRG